MSLVTVEMPKCGLIEGSYSEPSPGAPSLSTRGALRSDTRFLGGGGFHSSPHEEISRVEIRKRIACFMGHTLELVSFRFEVGSQIPSRLEQRATNRGWFELIP